jgi:superfamily II DNA or RNA helicase
MLARLRVGTTLVLSNCSVLTEGWDLPALECAIIARPTASLALHLQMIGRVMRATEGKGGALVLDHAGNHHQHGLVTRRLEYTLDGDRKTGQGEPLGLRRCRECGLFFEVGRFACPECGWFPTAAEVPARELPPVHGEGELHEFDDSTYEYRAAAWQAIEEECEESGYREGWSKHQFKDRFGEWPTLGPDRELIDPQKATQDQKRHVYELFVRIAADKGWALGWASHRYREIFGCWPRGFVSQVRGAADQDRIRQRLQGAAT